MPKFKVTVTVEYEVHVEVEARDYDDAESLALAKAEDELSFLEPIFCIDFDVEEIEEIYAEESSHTQG